MPLELDATYTCPVCWEPGAIGVDPSGGRKQRLIEDCAVCCNPLVFDVLIDGDGEARVAHVEAE